MAHPATRLRPYEILRFNVHRRQNVLHALLRFPRLTRALLFLLRPLYEARENRLNRTFRYGLLTFGGGYTPAAELAAMRHGVKAIRDNLRAVLRAAADGEPVVWVEWILTSELLQAFGAVAYNTESLNIFGNLKGMEIPPLLIEEAERQGTPPENCSAVKLSVGSYLLRQIPPPTLIVGASHPCDSSVSVYQTLEYLTGAPTFAMDMPYWRDEASVAYFERVTWDLIAFLEEHLGRKIDWDALREVLDRVNRFNAYLREICEMSRAAPCPASRIALLFAWVVREVNVSSPDALRMARGLCAVTRKRYEQGRGVVRREKVRVLKWFPPIGYFTYLFKWMEIEFGAVVVADFIGHVSTVHIDTATPESMVRGLARTQMHLAMGRQCHGPVEFLIEELDRLIEAYAPDCVLFMGHVGCKHGWAALRIVQDFLRRRGLPALYLTLDIMDQRHTSEQGLRDQIRRFFEQEGWA